MLQRIISIRNIGRFRNSSASGDVTFRRITLIFAENGRGKTTLCAILRSLSTNAPAIILGRRTLGSVDAPEVQLLIDGARTTFRAGAWSTSLPDVLIFDGAYISANIFAGDVVDTDNKRNLYRIIIGDAGVALAARVNELDSQIRVKNGEIREVQTRMQAHMPPGMTTEAFTAISEDPDIDQKIDAKTKELEATNSATELAQRASCTAVAIPVFPPNFAELLGKTLENLTGEVETAIREHIATHRMQANGESWLREGLSYVVDEACPFCGQETRDVDLIQAYGAFFSEAYNALRQEVRELGQQIETAFSDRAVANIQQTILQNHNHVEFWSRYCKFEVPSLPEAGRIGDIFTELRDVSRSLCSEKEGKPLETIAPNERYTQALRIFEELRSSLAVYNAAVAAANSAIALKRQATQVSNSRDIENSLRTLKAQKARHTGEVSGLCDFEVARQGEKRVFETDKVAAREQLDAHTAQVINRYGEGINKYLERINAGFRITTPSHNYRGGVPNTSYQILINNQSVDLGDAETPQDEPSFRNTLSAGDRTTLALAFFLAQFGQDPERARKIVILDDPFSSMDGFRRNNTIHRILKCSEGCTQIIVLSHERNFLKSLWDQIIPADRKALQLTRLGEENTTILEWDIEQATQARYRGDIDALQKFFESGEGEPLETIQKLRPVLEGYCKLLYTSRFDALDTLGVIVGKIRGDAAHPLQPIADDLDEINVYSRRYHHGENPGAATEPINDIELQGYIRRTLGLVGYTI
jgi:wobble nucleotide-excising tRNase